VRDELSEIYQELWDLGLPARAYFLIAKLHNINLMHPDHIAAEAKRAKDRERKRVSTDSTEAPIILLDNNSEGGVGGTNPRNSTENPPSRKPFDALAPVLGAELGRAIVEHRQKLRSPLTLKAAEMLAKRLQSFPDPKAAAEKMLERGWKSIEPDWGVNGLGPKKPKTGAVLQFRPEAPVISNDEWRKKREGP
jgi:hypothetical protein